MFLPQRDGVESEKSPYNEMTHDELRKTIFELDRDRILQADIFLFSCPMVGYLMKVRVLN